MALAGCVRQILIYEKFTKSNSFLLSLSPWNPNSRADQGGFGNDCRSTSAQAGRSNGFPTMPINSLWPNDAIWRHISRSTLAQVMACCLTAPSHYLNQCWLIFRKVQWHSVRGNLTRDSSPFNHWNKLENYMTKILFKSPRGQCVKY